MKIKSIIAVFILLLSSCGKSFVELTPEGSIPVSSYYQTESDIKAALTGAYGSLRTIYNNYWQFFEVPSDNTQTFGESEAGYGPMDKLTYQATTTNVSTGWSNAYATIAYCNAILDNIDNVTMTDAAKAQYVGEAKFLRALMYFDLVRMFGGVPLVLKSITTEAEAYTYLRSTDTEVYTQIETDLTEAATGLPDSYTSTSDIGRATSGAAKSLLGRVYIQEKKWSLAETVLAEVIASGNYQLLSDVANVFASGNDNNAEIVFAVQYISGGYGLGNSFSYSFAPQTSGTTIVSITAASSNIGTQDLYDSFETGDVRKDMIGVFQNGSNVNIYYWTKKFVDATVTASNEGANDWPVIRYADVLLMYAEALNNNGKTTEAINYINMTRTRAGLTALSGLSQDDTQLALEKERRAELCYEGFRWPDLIRWGKAISVMTDFKANYTYLDAAIQNMYINENVLLLPIPYREITLNPNLTQNPGY
ncbi:MAG: RagB/SusD family nutrient uptake outer membrane protein [Siphonobacter sp.]